MLIHLKIKNFAIIENLALTLDDGLNTISGETGAGKSIIINAVNLILGERSSSDLIRTGCREAHLEALFSFPNNTRLAAILNEWHIPFEKEIQVVRKISRTGRNKVFINTQPATLQMLNRLGAQMVSISGQHAHQQLMKPEQCLYLLDQYCGLEMSRGRFQALFEEYGSQKLRIKTLEKKILSMRERQELEAFQLQEIDTVQPLQNEESGLQAERLRLQHAEELMEIARESHGTLYERSDSVLSLLARCAKRLAKGSEVDKRLEPITSSLREIEANIEDISFRLLDFGEKIEVNPKRLALISDRLDALNRLKRKYGGTLEAVNQFREILAGRTHDLEEKKAEQEKLAARIQKIETELVEKAQELSRSRRQGAIQLQKDLERELRQLNMVDTRFNVHFEQDAESLEDALKSLGADGCDHVVFMLSTNPGEAMKPMNHIASGGELSRIMLGIKTILAKTASVETLIFDEVDTGISGATAQVVGEKLSSLAAFHQILCITHLPQIACQGKSHYRVSKDVKSGRTHADIQKLSPKDRIHEIARLLGGKETTPHALAHAEAMLKAVSG